VLRQELGLVRGHVDRDRAVALAALTGEAEVEGVGDFVRAEAVLDDVPLSIS